MAGITQKSFEILFPLRSLKKKTVVGYIGLEQRETYEKLKIELDIVSDTGILTMLLPVIITKMIILLLALLLLLLSTNESSNCNSYNNINVLIIKIIITIKTKSDCP